MTYPYGKLIRDYINPDGLVTVEIDNDEWYEDALRKKLIEEVVELAGAIRGKDRNHIIEELADVETVLFHVTQLFGIEQTEVNRLSMIKARDKGTFSKRKFLILDAPVNK